MILVEEIQLVLGHTKSFTLATDDSSYNPKSVPNNVIAMPPVTGEFVKVIAVIKGTET